MYMLVIVPHAHCTLHRDTYMHLLHELCQFNALFALLISL